MPLVVVSYPNLVTTMKENLLRSVVPHLLPIGATVAYGVVAANQPHAPMETLLLEGTIPAGIVVHHYMKRSSSVLRVLLAMLHVYPKSARTYPLKDMFSIILHLLKDPQQVASVTWAMIAYLSRDPAFKEKYGEQLKRLARRLVVAADKGAKIKVVGVQGTAHSMAALHNNSDGVIKTFIIPDEVATLGRPIMVITLRNGDSFGFYNLNYRPGVDRCCFTTSSHDERMEDVEFRMGQILNHPTCRPFTPDPIKPRERERTADDSKLPEE